MTHANSLARSLVSSLVLSWLLAAAAWPARAQQVGLVRKADVGTGSLLLRTTEPGQYLEAPRLKNDVEISVTGTIVRTRVTRPAARARRAVLRAGGAPALGDGPAADRAPVLSHRSVVACAAALSLGAGTVLGGHGLYLRAKAALAEILLERAWQATVSQGRPVKAWPWADTWPVARLRFPRLRRSAVVLAAAGGEALAFAPAHVAATPLPGESGTSVVAGHRDTHFRFIRELVAGDEIELTSAHGVTRRFRVTGFAVVDARASGIDAGGDAPRLALVTCWPFDGLRRGTQRYVVFAE